MHRCQVAVMMVDIVGYARMVCDDEERAVARMLRLRSETIETFSSVNRGRVVDYAGDGALLRFAETDQAMACAIEFQTQLAAIEKEELPGWRVQLRIGIDNGSVIVTQSGIAGQHVNIAARLESLAGPGEICLSRDAYRALSDNHRQALTFRGTRKLKHIERPVDVWSWPQQPASVACLPGRPQPNRKRTAFRPLVEPDRVWKTQRLRLH